MVHVIDFERCGWVCDLGTKTLLQIKLSIPLMYTDTHTHAALSHITPRSTHAALTQHHAAPTQHPRSTLTQNSHASPPRSTLTQQPHTAPSRSTHAELSCITLTQHITPHSTTSIPLQDSHNKHTWGHDSCLRSSVVLAQFANKFDELLEYYVLCLNISTLCWMKLN